MLNLNQSARSLRLPAGQSADQQDVSAPASSAAGGEIADAPAPSGRIEEPDGDAATGIAADQETGLTSKADGEFRQVTEASRGREHDPGAPSLQMESELPERIAGELQLVACGTGRNRPTYRPPEAALVRMPHGEPRCRGRRNDALPDETGEAVDGFVVHPGQFTKSDRERRVRLGAGVRAPDAGKPPHHPGDATVRGAARRPCDDGMRIPTKP
ncbi:hypothetical protein ABEV34_29950, partial [Methylorubrum rhodesianum]|uniref:hypothetical protein n=1 Tax=Methylorubrum rhodesianum TaxID=29427 RepID=UPI003D2749DC